MGFFDFLFAAIAAEKKPLWEDTDSDTDWFDHDAEDHDTEDGFCMECDEDEADLED